MFASVWLPFVRHVGSNKLRGQGFQNFARYSSFFSSCTNHTRNEFFASSRSSSSLKPKTSCAIRYSRDRLVWNMSGSSVFSVTCTPASNNFRTGCWSTAVQQPVIRLLVMHTSTGIRSEEHTSELQSLRHLVCRLLL